MAVYCPRCGSFNKGQALACLTCLGPLAKGQSVPEDARCYTHADQSPLGRCMSCGNATCFECGSMVDGKILCFTDAAATATVDYTQTTQPQQKKKGGFSFGKKK